MPFELATPHAAMGESSAQDGEEVQIRSDAACVEPQRPVVSYGDSCGVLRMTSCHFTDHLMLSSVVKLAFAEL